MIQERAQAGLARAVRVRRFRVHHRHRHRLLTLAHVPADIAGDDVGGDIT
jgi:hypothetical protein